MTKLNSFKLHYEQTHNFVRTTLYWMVRTEIIDELVQETYLKAWRNFSSFKQESSFKTWIYRIARNTALDFLRKEKKPSLEAPENKSSAFFENRDLITKGLLRLSPKHREVFILFYKLELAQDEIAELIAIPIGTVKSRLHQAKKEFVAFLENNEVHHG